MNHKIEKLKVILVDDMEDEHVIFKKALSAMDYIHLEFQSFKTAGEFEHYLDSASGIAAHIVFLDMHLPDKSGFECLKGIRSNPAYKQLVVAMYSVDKDERTISKCLGQGANIYITKPREFGLLKQRLKEVLRSCMQYHSMGMKFETFVRCF